jgi:hypothetical protein
MQLTSHQIRKYFESVLGTSLKSGKRVAVHCPIPGHPDKTASATAFTDGNGGFNCSGCGFRGNLFQLTARIKGISVLQAEDEVARITGADSSFGKEQDAGALVGTYDYRDANGALVFQKRKYRNEDGKKTFLIYHDDDGKGWRKGIGDTEEKKKFRPLYNLPFVISSNLVWMAEGESDADTLADMQPWYPDHPGFITSFTTSYAGAWRPGTTPKWEDHWNAAFYQKAVILFQDNDESGREYTEFIARSIHPYALFVRIVEFRDLPEKGDVSDWLKTHTKQQLLQRIKDTPNWQPRIKERESSRIFVSAVDFMTSENEEIDWLIPGVIQRGANGFFAGTPKAAKSFVCVDMCLSLATATPWLGFDVPFPVKTGLVTREDNPQLTRWRMRRLFSGKDCLPNYLNNLWVNSRQQTSEMFLDKEENVVDLIAAIRSRELEIVFLDVFNVLHGAEENDNTAMRKILNKCRRIQDESGAAIGIVHHLNKEVVGSVTQRLRGASAIAGYAEWIIGISLKDEAERTRQADFEMKVSAPPESFEFKINEDKENMFVRIERTGVVSTPRVNARAALNGKARMPYVD